MVSIIEDLIHLSYIDGGVNRGILNIQEIWLVPESTTVGIVVGEARVTHQKQVIKLEESSKNTLQGKKNT